MLLTSSQPALRILWIFIYIESADTSVCYVGVKKSQVRYEEQKILLTIDSKTSGIKISEYKEEGKSYFSVLSVNWFI